MRRRHFIAVFGGAALARPFAARATGGPARIALLGSGAADTSAAFVDAFKEGLRGNGLIESRDYMLDVRWAEGVYERFPALARDVVQRDPRVILVTTIAAVRAAQRATTTIPIVMTTINNPVGAGLIASLARPGGNTTGIANLTEDITPKVLDIVRAVVPKVSVIAILFNPANPSNRVMLEKIRQGSGTAAAIRSFEFKPGTLDGTFDQIARQRPDALLVINDAAIIDERAQIATLALHHRIPAFSSIPEMTEAGGLAGYGPPRLELYRRSANYVKKILDGAKPADLPVEQPTRVELSVNLRTAKALGLTIPPSLLQRADQVIE
jgi:putative tryptophan/tyrosine transport system substrate-binding protein